MTKNIIKIIVTIKFLFSKIIIFFLSEISVFRSQLHFHNELNHKTKMRNSLRKQRWGR